MTLLLDEIDVIETSGDVETAEVLGVEHDSRRVAPGDLFCCLPGRTTDGHEHAAEAVARGAVGLVCERALGPLERSVVQVRIPPGTARPSMARLAAAYWGDPAGDLLTVGVTGTNGKTTVTHLLGAVLASTGRPTTVVGTLSGARTTPEATDLQRTLAALRDAHTGEESQAAAVMEVSSHALVQSRVDGIRFDLAVFTNLSHDHLDFHKSMGAYFEAKAALFEPERARLAVVDVDDPWGARLADRTRVPTVAVHADWASDVRLEAGRTRFVWRDREVDLAMTGLVNVRNALLAAEAAAALGVPPEAVVQGLASAEPVPGRLETVAAPGRGRSPFTVLVDYAHTPAALEAALTEVGRLAADEGGRTIVVFGCGGDRDRAKRPLMGALVSRMADVAVLTSDNPRHEDPAAIAADVLAGAVPSGTTVELDRRRAIETALTAARPGDVVLIAGKGHETYQEVGEERMPFDDRLVAAGALAVLFGPVEAPSAVLDDPAGAPAPPPAGLEDVG